MALTWQDPVVFEGPSGLTYHAAWQGEGPTLMLLHGFTGHKNSFGDLTCQLAGYFRLLGVDLPGHGKAIPVPAKKLTFLHVIEDLEALLDQLNQTSVHCTGYSMGGRIGLALACRAPTLISSLSVISGSPGLSDASERETRSRSDRDLMSFMQHTPSEVFHDYWEHLPLFETSSSTATKSSQQQRLAWSRSLSFLGTGFQPSLWSKLSQVTIPVLFIVGQRDRRYVDIAMQMRERVPDSSLVVIANAGHRVHLDNPDNVARHITRYVAASVKGKKMA